MSQAGNPPFGSEAVSMSLCLGVERSVSSQRGFAIGDDGLQRSKEK